MRFDLRLEDRISRITPYTDNGENRTENGEWKMESEAAKENEGTTYKESSLGSSTRGNGMSPLQYHKCYANGQEWMRLDFAEERRWKRVLAREFAYQVVEWHLSSSRDKASLMVGGIGWGARRRASASAPKSKTNGTSAPEIGDKDSAGDDVAMDDEGAEENTGGQVLDEIMPRRATRGRKPKRRVDAEEDLTPEPESTKDADDKMDTGEAEPSVEPAAEPTDEALAPHSAAPEDADKPISAKSVSKADADAEGEADADADADGEADAEGEVDAQGEDDGESADVVDGVVGLGGKSTPKRLIRTDFRYSRCGWCRR